MILLPINEKREFKYGVLPNNLKYTIIHDSSSINANVVMSVKTGNLYDPNEYMGLAHFLEHMLFMGSKKYTEEDYFSRKLKDYGGSSNAYTDSFETVYYFNVLSNNLDNIIDVFSRFFIDPLFDINAVSREINAVNSEHLKNFNNDFWVIRQIILNVTKKDSVVNKFGTGSHETLGSDYKKVRDEMIKFYNKYYCSNNMCLTIQSNLPIKDVEKIIKKSFSEVA
jgi:insulysin